ncbi:MAG: hypothetical protein WA849_13150 [Candidatus Udaeobacter sp.]
MEAESLPMIEVDGAQIGYRRIGNGRPLLVLNGFAATSADWDPFNGGGHAFMYQYPRPLADLINSFLAVDKFALRPV